MINMHYVMFQNTLEALKECQEALDEGVGPLSLSKDEGNAMFALIDLCGEIFENYADGTEGFDADDEDEDDDEENY